MDTTTSIITIAISVCILAFAVVAVAGSLYGILIWYPNYRKKKVDMLKASGRQGEATILRLPNYDFRTGYRRFVYKVINIGLEIRAPGIDTYEVDKYFSFPTHALDLLEEGKVVAVWVDPKEPRNLDKIVIDVK